MEAFIALGLLSLIGWAVFKAGKRIGSRRGYGAARAQAQAQRYF